MPAVEDLTPLGILGKQRPLAMQALRENPIRPLRVDLVSHATNYIYRVTANDGARYALRLVAPYWRTEDNLRAEVMWLDALARDTDIPVPRLVPTSSGAHYVRLTPAGGRPGRRAVLMRWLPGRLLAICINGQDVRRMGELFARLHDDALGWTKPAGFPTCSFESFLGRGEPDVLFDEAA